MSAADIQAETSQYCTFKIGTQLYGIRLREIKEVCQNVHLTPIHLSSRFVTGCMNLRGKIHLILDLPVMLGRAKEPIQSENRVIILRDAIGEAFGIKVDEIIGVRDGADSSTQLINPQSGDEPLNEHIHKDLVYGVCKLQSEILLILNAHLFLDFI